MSKLARSTIDIDISSEIGVSEEDKKIYVCYPVEAEALDVITIHCGDIRRLNPRELLNDNLVDFGIRYMLAGVDPLKRAKIHAFTCLFYTKLMEGKLPQEQHLLVSRWTKKIDLFDMDYIIVPVNLTGHWSLFVIVKPGRLVETTAPSSSSHSDPVTTVFPYILHMDSLQLHSASTITSNLRNYLMEEWKEKRAPTCALKQLSINENNCITLKVTVPRQLNGTDCGVYVIENARRVVLHQPSCTVECIKQIKKGMFNFAFLEADANLERIRLSSYLKDLKPQYDAVLKGSSSDKGSYTDFLSNLSPDYFTRANPVSAGAAVPGLIEYFPLFYLISSFAIIRHYLLTYTHSCRQ